MKTQEEIIGLLPTDTFRFLCKKENACFNECCANLNQYLTPYDILRLKNALNITSDLFLQKYCDQYKGPETGLWIVSLKPDYKNGLRCPFVTEKGCKVYENRPASCRLYPLARMISKSRQTGKITEYFALIKEEHCKGFGVGKEYTPQKWIENQKAEEYNKINDKLIEIIGIANELGKKILTEDVLKIFSVICYDQDAFKTALLNKIQKIKEDIKDYLKIKDIMENNEKTRLKFGLEYLKNMFLKLKNNKEHKDRSLILQETIKNLPELN